MGGTGSAHLSGPVILYTAPVIGAARSPLPDRKSVIMRAAIDVDRLAGDEPAILADQEPAYNSLRFRTVGWQIPSQEGRGGENEQ